MELTNTFTVTGPVEEMWPILCDIERIAPCMPGARLTEVEGDEYRGEVKVKVGPINARFAGRAAMLERDDEAHRAVLEASGKDTAGKGNASATITATAAATPDGGTEVTIATDLRITGKVAQFGRSAMGDISTKLLGQFVACLESRVLSGGSDADGAPDDPAPDAAASVAGPSEHGGPADAGLAEDAAPLDDGMATGDGAAAGDAAPPDARPSEDAAPPDDGAATGRGDGPTAGAAANAAGGGAAAGSAATSGPRTVDAPEAEPIDLLDAAGGPVAKKLAFPVAAVMAVFFALYWRRRRSG